MSINNYYIVNSAIYNNVDKPQSVDDEAENIISKASEIATGGRKVAVVLGLNAPESTHAFPSKITEKDMADAKKRIMSLAKKLTEGNENIEVHVIDYRWERFDDRLRKDGEFKANERINYVAIRNNLFYSTENQEVIKKFINEAEKQDNASVKLFALDGDSDTSDKQVTDLEEHWRSQTKDKNGETHLPPLITTGYYQFKIDDQHRNLHEVDGKCNWGLFLATIENQVDIRSKQRLSSEQFKGTVLYRKFNLPENDTPIDAAYIFSRRQKLEKNLYLLDKQKIGEVDSNTKEKLDHLKIHICDILSLLPAYKEALEGTDLESQFAYAMIHKQIVSSLREIEKLEKSFDNLEDLKHEFVATGKQVLYPSENVMFVSLYDKLGDKQFNVFNEMQESVKEQATKVRKLWGNDVGREEGENIAVQMRKFWKDSHKNGVSKKPPAEIEDKRIWAKQKVRSKIEQPIARERDVVDFAHLFKTALPSRAHEFLTEKQQKISQTLPQTLDEVRKATQNEDEFNKLIDTTVELIATRSQTSLSTKFASQRLRYLKGEQSPVSDLEEPGKKLSVFSKALRAGTSEAFNQYFQEFQQERINELRQEIRRSILDSL